MSPFEPNSFTQDVKQSLKFSSELSTVHKHPLLSLRSLKKEETGSKNKLHVKLHPVSVSSSPWLLRGCDTEETTLRRFRFTELGDWRPMWRQATPRWAVWDRKHISVTSAWKEILHTYGELRASHKQRGGGEEVGGGGTIRIWGFERPLRYLIFRLMQSTHLIQFS